MAIFSSKPRTQKAIGILYGVSDFLSQTGSQNFFRNCTDQLYTGKIVDVNFPVFARPCPMKPRHGFVDSRIVYTPEELIALYNEVKKHDKRGELLISEAYCEVVRNSVYVSSGLLSIGPGNDGATGGNNSVSFNVAPFKCDSLKAVCKVNKNDALYIEEITTHKNVTEIITQLRGGPTLNTTELDFIPKATTVTKVVTPLDDLLAWEKKVKTLKAGTVVWGAGHTLASHAAVHCVINNIPFITSKMPNVGDKLKRNKGRVKAPISVEQFKRGVKYGMAHYGLVRNEYLYDTNALRSEAAFCIAVLHNWPWLMYDKNAGFILGAASAMFLRLGSSLSFGELRHKKYSKYVDRNKIYVQTNTNPSKHVAGLYSAFKAFYSGYWRGGFGGIPWANCTWKLIEFSNALRKAYRTRANIIPNDSIVGLISEMNKSVNMAHNCGWWFGKLIDPAALDLAANEPGLIALFANKVFYDVGTAIKKNVTVDFNVKFPNVTAKNLPFAVHNNKLLWAVLNISKYEYESAVKHYPNTKAAISLYSNDKHRTIYRKLSVPWNKVKITKACFDSRKVILPIVKGRGFKNVDGTIIKMLGAKS